MFYSLKKNGHHAYMRHSGLKRTKSESRRPHLAVRGAKPEARKSELGSSGAGSNPKVFKFLKQKTLSPRKETTNYMFTPTKTLPPERDASPIAKRELQPEPRFERVA